MSPRFQFKPNITDSRPLRSSSRRFQGLETAARTYAALVILSVPERNLRKLLDYGDEELKWLIGLDSNIENLDTRQVLAACHAIVRNELAKSRRAPLWFDARLEDFCRQLDISEAAWNIIRLALVSSLHRDFDELLGQLQPHSTETAYSILASTTGCRVKDIQRAMSAYGPLQTFGIIEPCPRGHRVELNEFIAVSSDFQNALIDDAGASGVLSQLVGDPGTSSLRLSDFPHYSNELRIVSKVLSGAIKQREVGVHILLYGPPGSGKSEMARVLAQTLGLRALAVADRDNDGEPMSDSARMARYATNQALAGKTSDFLVVFDEAEAALEGELDNVMALFGERSIHSSQKGTLNKSLETAAAPTIWICNSIDRFDPATLRRMTLCLHVEAPPTSIRRKLARAKLLESVPEPIIERIAQFDQFMPADLCRVAQVARLCGGTLSEKDSALVASSRPGTPGRVDLLRARKGHLEFRLDWINADPDICSLTEKMRLRGHGRCGFFGPPGTGKTVFAKHIANSLQKKLVMKSASDLLGMYVGETEQLIASAFREAERDDAVLLIDEVDSFLRNRSECQKSWEVTQVNELLTQIDNYEGYLVVCSNFEKTLDPALARRLQLKARFQPMAVEHLSEAIACAAKAIGLSKSIPRPAALRIANELQGLTPGDIEAAIESLLMSSDCPDLDALERALHNECSYKLDQSSCVGFIT